MHGGDLRRRERFRHVNRLCRPDAAPSVDGDHGAASGSLSGADLLGADAQTSRSSRRDCAVTGAAGRERRYGTASPRTCARRKLTHRRGRNDPTGDEAPRSQASQCVPRSVIAANDAPVGTASRAWRPASAARLPPDARRSLSPSAARPPTGKSPADSAPAAPRLVNLDGAAQRARGRHARNYIASLEGASASRTRDARRPAAVIDTSPARTRTKA